MIVVTSQAKKTISLKEGTNQVLVLLNRLIKHLNRTQSFLKVARMNKNQVLKQSRKQKLVR